MSTTKFNKRPGAGRGTSNGAGLDSDGGGQRALESSFLLAKQTYKYSKLGTDEIRLIQFQPAPKQSDTIHCKFKVRRLNDPELHYEALSYTWGYEEATEEIMIESEGGKARKWEVVHDRLVRPRPFYIRPNLDQALRYLRFVDDGEGGLFWIDAICMNQEDESEKSIQVGKMAEIYSHADGVFIWLGKELDNSALGMDFVEQILKLEQQDTFSVKGLAPQQWIAFMSLMGRAWFQRRWVVQELALARNAYVTCGESSVNWAKFGSAVRFFTDRLDTLYALYNDSAEFKQKLSALGTIRTSGAYQLIETTDNVLRGSHRMKTLESLVSELAMFEVGDPRDAIYALMSLAKDAARNSRPEQVFLSVFETDYSKDILQVFKDFTAFCINASDTLNIICRKWAPNRRRKKGTMVRFRGLTPPTKEVLLPSWIGLFKDSAYGLSSTDPRKTGPRTRGAADTLVDAPGRGQYNASGTRKAQVLFGEVRPNGKESDTTNDYRNTNLKANPSEWKATTKQTLQKGREMKSNGTLYARGFEIDVITKISHRLFEGLIPSEWLTLGGWVETPGEDEADTIPDQLWRTLVADKTPDGKPAPSTYRELMGWVIGRRNVNDDIHTAELIRQGVPEVMITFLKRVQSITWNKRLFVLSGTTELTPQDNQFGLAPSHAQTGDIICILLGCSVPVVLRPVDKSPGSECFELIGEAYVYGIMEGEALERYSHQNDEEVRELSKEFCII